MNKIAQAKIILKSLESHEYRIEEIENNIDAGRDPTERYSQSLSNSLENIIKTGIEIFDVNEGFLKVLIGEIGEYGPTPIQLDIIKNYFEVYVTSQKPAYMDDLLQYSKKFRDEYLYNNAAFSIRLYAETCLKIKLEDYEFIKGKSFGWIWTESRKRGLIDEDLMDKHKPKIDELNNMIHNSMKKEYCPATTERITALIQWASEYEAEIEPLNLEP